MKSILLIDPHLSRAYASKLRGFVERLPPKTSILLSDSSEQSFADARQWSVDIGLLEPMFLTIDDHVDLSDMLLLIDCRTVINEAIFHQLKRNAVRVLLSANHFMCANMETVASIKSLGNFVVLLENDASRLNVQEAWLFNGDVEFLTIPPLLDSKSDVSRFNNMALERDLDSGLNRTLHAGVMVLHRPNNTKWPLSWWQKKFSCLDYYPWRSRIHGLSKEIGITSLSVLVEDNSRRNNLLNKLIRRFEILFGIQKARYNKYYSIDLKPYFKSHQFFFCPQDIFSVFPQFGFQAMRAGLIIIGDESKAFSSLGFVDGLNYISVGSEWTESGVVAAHKRAVSMSLDDVSFIRKNSQDLLRKNVFKAEGLFRELITNDT